MGRSSPLWKQKHTADNTKKRGGADVDAIHEVWNAVHNVLQQCKRCVPQVSIKDDLCGAGETNAKCWQREACVGSGKAAAAAALQQRWIMHASYRCERQGAHRCARGETAAASQAAPRRACQAQQQCVPSTRLQRQALLAAASCLMCSRKATKKI